MKSISGPLDSHLQGGSNTLSRCWLVTRTDGQVFGFTEADTPILYNGVLYEASSGMTPSALTEEASLAVGNMSMSGFLASPSITTADLYAGLWDWAELRTFLLNRRDLTMGELKVMKGHFGQFQAGRTSWTAELRSLVQAYSRNIGQIYSAGCRADLGDTHCKVRLQPPVWVPQTATVVINGDAAVGTLVRPTTYNGFYYSCTTAGTTSGTEPSWNTSLGGTTTDGSVIWTTTHAWTVQGTVTGVSADNRTIFDTGRTEPGPSTTIANISGITQASTGVVTATAHGFINGDIVIFSNIGGMTQLDGVVSVVTVIDANHFSIQQNTSQFTVYTSGGTAQKLFTAGWFDHGKITFTSGLNNGLSMEIKNYVPGILLLELPMPYAVAVNDTYQLTVGCNKLGRAGDCKLKFNNIFNMRAEPDLPGQDKVLQVGGR